MLRCRGTLTAVVSIGLAAVLAGCASDRDATGWATRIDTLDGGAIRVVNTPPADASPLDERAVEEAFRIGGPEVEGPASFGQLAQIAVDPDGRIAALDWQAQQLRIFGADGRHLHTFGGRGGGPGELDWAFGVIADGERLLVPEYGNARLSVFHPDSGFIESHRTRFYSYGPFGWDAAIDTAGRIVVPSSGLAPAGGQYVMRVYDRTMVPLDTLAYRAYPDEESSSAWRVSLGRGTFTLLPVPFHAREHQVVDPTGALWFAEARPEYRLKRYIPGGDTLRVVEVRRSPTPVAPAERDSAVDAIRAQLRERGVNTEPDWSRVPDVHPAIHGLHLSDEGDLWVRTSAPAEATTTYDLFTPDGVYRGTARIPGRVHRFIEPVVRDGRVWAVVVDELDVMYLLAGRLVASPSGSPTPEDA